MNIPENDNDLAPHEEVEEAFNNGEIEYETAVIKLLSMLNEAAYCLVVDVDKIVNMAAAKGETKH